MTSAEVERRVREVVARCVHVSPESVGGRVPFEELGLDSVGALDLVERLQATFRLSIPEGDEPHLGSVDAIVRYLERRLPSSRAGEAR